MIGHQPQFAERCPWEKMDRYDWAILIREQERFADRCPYENPIPWRKDDNQDLTESEHLVKIEVFQRLIRYDREKCARELSEALDELVSFYINKDDCSKLENALACSLEVNRRIARYDKCGEEVVARDLHVLASHHRVLNRVEEAVEEYSQAFRCYQDLYQSERCQDIAEALHELGEFLLKQGNGKKAEEALSLVLEIHRWLARDKPAKFDAFVARSLNDLAILHKGMNRLADAEREYDESLEIYRRLVEDNPAQFANMAQLLNNLAILHKGMGRLADAEREYDESLEIRRRLAKDNPAKFEENVAQSLNNLAILHTSMKLFSDAEREYTEAQKIFRRLAKDNPAKFKALVAQLLKNLAVLHKNMNRLADAGREYAESLEIYEKLAVDCPEKFNGKLAKTLQGQAKLFLKEGEREAAKANLERVVKILDPLVANGKKSLERDLNQAVELLATL